MSWGCPRVRVVEGAVLDLPCGQVAMVCWFWQTRSQTVLAQETIDLPASTTYQVSWPRTSKNVPFVISSVRPFRVSFDICKDQTSEAVQTKENAHLFKA